MGCSLITEKSAAQAIEHRLKSTFDKPNSPLLVKPIVIDGDYAVAGWSQDGRGGRALLKKEKAGWTIKMCAGETLKKADTLQSMGLSKANAIRLSSSLVEEESNIDPLLVELLSSFKGTVMMDGGHHPPLHHSEVIHK